MRIRLRDGRHLGIEERGAETGTPLIWLTGTPGARTWRPPDEEALRARAAADRR